MNNKLYQTTFIEIIVTISYKKKTGRERRFFFARDFNARVLDRYFLAVFLKRLRIKIIFTIPNRDRQILIL